MEPLSSISPVNDRGTDRLSEVSIFLGLTRILFTIAHTSGSPDWQQPFHSQGKGFCIVFRRDHNEGPQSGGTHGSDVSSLVV
jgi:hypothetical protein